MTSSVLEGRAVLVAEDEYLVAMGLEEQLRSCGAEVLGPVATVTQAMQLAERDLDLALLDVNLGGEMIFPVADYLVSRGVPIVFTTGYDASDVPARFAEVPLLQKPFKFDRLKRTIGQLALR